MALRVITAGTQLAVVVGLVIASSPGRAFGGEAVGSPAWKQATEAALNAPDQEDQARISGACGHGVKFRFDWSAFKPEDWKQDADRLGGMCPYEASRAMKDLCEGAPEYKAAMASVKQLICKPKACTQLRDQKRLQTDYDLSADMSTFTIGYCAGGSNSEAATEALHAGLYTPTPQGNTLTHELVWRRQTEDRANLRDTAYAQSTDGHELMKTECGHDAKVEFDWSSIKMKDYWVPGNADLHEMMTEWFAAEVLKNIGRTCKENKKLLAGVTKVVCHGATAKSLEQARSGPTTTEPVAKFKIKGDELHVWFAPGTKLSPGPIKLSRH